MTPTPQYTFTPEDIQKAGKGIRLILGLAFAAMVKTAVDVHEDHERIINVKAVFVSPPASLTAELGVAKGSPSLHAPNQPEQGEFWPSLR